MNYFWTLVKFGEIWWNLEKFGEIWWNLEEICKHFENSVILLNCSNFLIFWFFLVKIKYSTCDGSRLLSIMFHATLNVYSVDIRKSSQCMLLPCIHSVVGLYAQVCYCRCLPIQPVLFSPYIFYSWGESAIVSSPQSWFNLHWKRK